MCVCVCVRVCMCVCCTGNDTRLCDHDLLVLPPSPLSLHGAYHLLLLLMYVAYSVLVSLYLSVCLSVCLSRYPRSLPTCVRFERACVFARVDVCVRAHEHCIVRIHARASRLFKIQSNTGLPTTPTPISIHASCALSSKRTHSVGQNVFSYYLQNVFSYYLPASMPPVL